MANILEREAQADIKQRHEHWKAVKGRKRRLRPDSQRRRKDRPALPAVGEGYDGLPVQHGWVTTPDGFKWATLDYSHLATVAMRFAMKAKAGEKDDLLHTIIEGLARVAQRKASNGEDFTEPAMHRTAEHIKDYYWYKHYAYNNGLDCRNCTKEQKAKCRYNWAHSDWAYADCHRAIQLESINQPINDEEGNITELADLIADDKALDIEAWVDARTFMIGAPIRLKLIASKVRDGIPLTAPEKNYLSRLRKKRQRPLI